jgi:hypothetical protein
VGAQEMSKSGGSNADIARTRKLILFSRIARA